MKITLSPERFSTAMLNSSYPNISRRSPSGNTFAGPESLHIYKPFQTKISDHTSNRTKEEVED
ncbi:uncharacterized protein RAG0_15176 [Rhynchosporium agropyri]|uniref:Uncharacterized protein n=1 Tax=Rhynchosporium agropyri TaxID=914238 RepID=A0A1E1LK29_9HELO|nr:uncharacterized protein RAG0_15176 [Rhynchosporium agropyri]